EFRFAEAEGGGRAGGRIARRDEAGAERGQARVDESDALGKRSCGAGLFRQIARRQRARSEGRGYGKALRRRSQRHLGAELVEGEAPPQIVKTRRLAL